MPMTPGRIVIVGGGAAGFFAALSCAEAGGHAEIIILEKTAHFLSKVKISGGGRCNVTHDLFDEREFVTRYPRGERALIAVRPEHEINPGAVRSLSHQCKLRARPHHCGR